MAGPGVGLCFLYPQFCIHHPLLAQNHKFYFSLLPDPSDAAVRFGSVQRTLFLDLGPDLWFSQATAEPWTGPEGLAGSVQVSIGPNLEP